MIYIVIILSIFLIDIISKFIINKKFVLHESKEIVKNSIYIKHIKNEGAAYNIFSNYSDYILAVSGLVLSIVFVCFDKILKCNGRIVEKISLSFVIGGALGNFFERMKYRKVTDFLYLNLKKFPIFNIADIFIFVGSILLILSSMFFDKK